MKLALVLAALAALVTTGCAVEVQNAQTARQLAQESRPPGTAYIGWRVFQDRCARCHGENATGSATAPDLLVALRSMGQRGFVDAVLRRYDWDLPPAADDSAREARIDQVLGRRTQALSMPDWQGEPRVAAHIADLYAYLAARSDGSLGRGRPAP